MVAHGWVVLHVLGQVIEFYIIVGQIKLTSMSGM